jgi:hypothetical protein
MAKTGKVEGWDLVMARAKDACFDALNEIGMNAVADIRTMLMVPVEGMEGFVDSKDLPPGAKPFTPRSRPGEPPHMELNSLRSNIAYETGYDGENFSPTLDITAVRPTTAAEGEGSDPDAARILEEGGFAPSIGQRIEPRPFMRPEADQIEKTAPAVVARHIAIALTK